MYLKLLQIGCQNYSCTIKNEEQRHLHTFGSVLVPMLFWPEVTEPKRMYLKQPRIGCHNYSSTIKNEEQRHLLTFGSVLVPMLFWPEVTEPKRMYLKELQIDCHNHSRTINNEKQALVHIWKCSSANVVLTRSHRALENVLGTFANRLPQLFSHYQKWKTKALVHIWRGSSVNVVLTRSHRAQENVFETIANRQPQSFIAALTMKNEGTCLRLEMFKCQFL